MTIRALDLLLSHHWAMREEELRTYLQIAQRQGAGPEAVSVQMGRKLDNTRTAQVRNGVAVIPVTGPIFRRANILTQVSGATSIEVLARDLEEAASNDAVRAILLDVDSPGGQVTGTGEMAGLIAQIQKRKPVCAYAGGLCASAAYWLASACGAIVAAPTAIVGSIGVMLSLQKSEDGSIEIVSSQSPHKTMDVGTEEGRGRIQAYIDDLAEVFIGDVARYRGVSTQTVLSDFGAGGVLVGKKAVKAGLADYTGSFEGTLARLAAGKPLMRRERAEMSDTTGLAPLPEAEFLGLIEEADTAVLTLGGWSLGASTDDANLDTPPAGVSFEQQIETALAAVGDCVDRARDVKEMREAEGRRFSEARRAQLTGLHARLGELLQATAPRVDPARLLALRAETVRIEQTLIGS